MVRSHIGNVVCRKALCVRVASSPPPYTQLENRLCIFLPCSARKAGSSRILSAKNTASAFAGAVFLFPHGYWDFGCLSSRDL